MVQVDEIDNEEEDMVQVDEIDNEEDTESLLQRLAGLTDAFPLASRLAIKSTIQDSFNFTLNSIATLGNVAWVLTTAAMILVLPGALEIEKVSKCFDWGFRKVLA
jgi:predicted lysophospholipase L1 biosynthesis ABC-type transport system permease subunit